MGSNISPVAVGTDIMCLQLDEGLQLQNPTIIRGGEAAVAAADNTWPVVLLGMAIIVMVMLSTRNGVRAFSFALSYTNLWFFRGKRGGFRVRVQSFASNYGCFLTTSGEFTSGLEDEEQNEEGADRVARLDQNGSPGSSRSISGGYMNCGDGGNCANGSIVCTSNMVFTYGSCTSLFATEITGSSSGPKFRARLFVEEVFGNGATVSDGLEGVFSRHSGNEVPELRRVWDFDQRDLHRATEELSVVIGEVNRRRHLFPFKNSAVVVSRKKFDRRTAVVRHYPWDVEMKLRLAAQYVKNEFVPPAAQDLASIYCSPSAVVRGLNGTATLNKNVVKIWENSSRRVMVTLPPHPRLLTCTEGAGLASRSSSLDVNWEHEAVCLGSSDGFLSLWDLERASCVSIVGCHRRRPRPIHAVCFSNTTTASAGISGLTVTAEKCGGAGRSKCCVGLWDSRMLNGAAAAVDSMVTNYGSVPLYDMTVDSFELVFRNCFDSAISIHDIRMLKSSPVVFPSKYTEAAPSALSSDYVTLEGS